MNKRKEHISSHQERKIQKAVKEGVSKATTIAPKTPKKTAAARKSPSKRRENTELTPSHTTRESGRWAEVLRKQTEENEQRMQKHLQQK